LPPVALFEGERRRLVTYIDILVESYFAAELTLETRAYVGRGRMLENCSDQDVRDLWLARFNRWFEHRTTDHARSMSDAAAELRLRGLEEPLDQVKAKTDALRTEIVRLGPDAQPEWLHRRIGDFLAGELKSSAL
jgi:hypothetical protein